ncbi:SDR family oxidoreductase [Anaeromyxobacter dehalogenans]|nr:SDR family oxidoreductase [Anaeromyxobacter dehalogenans]
MTTTTGAGLKDRTVVVVGGGSGIGLAVAREALARGAEVVLAGRSRERLARALGALGAGARARAVAADVRQEDAVVRLFREVPAADHVVATAVVPAYQPIAAFDLEAARAVVDSKLLGALLLAKHGAPRLRPGGSLTFTTGIAADRPMPRGSVIAAVNGALAAFVRAAALELAPLRVNALSPGWVDTEIWDAVAGDGKAATFAAMAERLPARRIGRPEDVAHAAAFLMENGFTTGSVLRVDGGHPLV